MEKHHPTWSNAARKGIDKYTGLSSKAMREYKRRYEAGGKKYSDPKKQEFYEFVARARLRKKSK